MMPDHRAHRLFDPDQFNRIVHALELPEVFWPPLRMALALVEAGHLELHDDHDGRRFDFVSPAGARATFGRVGGP